MNPKNHRYPAKPYDSREHSIRHDLRHRLFLRALKLFSLFCFSLAFSSFFSRSVVLVASLIRFRDCLETCPPAYEIGFPVRSEYFTFGNRFSFVFFLRPKLVDVASSSESSTCFCTGCGFRPFIPAFLPFAASTVTSIRRFLRENGCKRTFVCLVSVDREDAVKDEENISYSLHCCLL